MDEMEIIESLYKLSDLTPEEYDNLKTAYLSKGQTSMLKRQLIGRSFLPRLRNTVKPPGEIYAPVMYCPDYMIKLVHKPRWGGYILALTVWDLVVIDIDTNDGDGPDDEDHLSYIEKNIQRYYPDDLFYVNKTRRGYHVYLVSRTVKHSSKTAIYMRIKLNSDPAHGSNSLYTGSSIRLSRKQADDGQYISNFLVKFGSGTPDPKALELYETIQSHIKRFSCYSVDDIVGNQKLMTELYSQWSACVTSNFGLTHIKVVAPALLINDNGNILFSKKHVFIRPEIISITHKVWSEFLRARKIKMQYLDILLFHAQHQMCMNNLYRIFEATEDYAIGVHVQESCYFISYRDLFFADIDHKNRLQIIYQYVRYHPEATFRIVETNKGYHAFLTSYPLHHNEGIPLSIRLCTEHCHLLSVYHRGYSVRVNQKYKKETPYKEIRKVGKAPEDPRLYSLYLKHLELYNWNVEHKTTLYMYQNNTAQKIVDDEGISQPLIAKPAVSTT
jgi:hypothetical protein